MATQVTVPSSNGIQLDASVFLPSRSSNVGRDETSGASTAPSLPIVLVHQYSLLGGNQTLLKGMARQLARRGFPCVTFDMRGVGKSTGYSSITGGPEVEDVVAVASWTAEHFKVPKVVLVGSSAGAPIAGSALDRVEALAGYVGIGYTFGAWASILFGRHFNAVLQSPKPKLFIMGTTDGFTSVQQLEKKLETANGLVEKYLFPGIGHFELEAPHYDLAMAELVAAFAKKILENVNTTTAS